MKRSMLATVLGALGASIGLGPSAEPTAMPGDYDTRGYGKTRSRKINPGTKPKFRFIRRWGNGFGEFLNLHTNTIEVRKIRSEGLSFHARVHFDIE